MLQKRRELTTFHFCSSTELCAVHHMFTFCIILFILSCFFFFTHLPPFCCIPQRPCVNISKQMHFFSSFSTITWCLFSVLFYVSASGIKLHLTFFCEQLTHTVWCCTKALCIIFVLLFSHLPLLSGDPSPSEIISYSADLSFLRRAKRNPDETRRFKASQTGTQSPSAAIRRENLKKKQKTRNQKQGAGLRPRARPVRIWEQCHIHITISFPTLSPIWKFPLKFLYFDIIKKYKRGLFSPQCVFCDGSHGNEGVVQALDTGCKCWAAGRQAASWVYVPGVGSRWFIVHFFYYLINHDQTTCVWELLHSVNHKPPQPSPPKHSGMDCVARTRKANKLKEDEICWDDLCPFVQIPFDKQPGRSLQVHMQEMTRAANSRRNLDLWFHWQHIMR